MNTTKNFENMLCVTRCTPHGPAPIPQEGTFNKAYDTNDISGFSHGVGTCANQQGACKLTLNVKCGIIEECLIEVIGCSGMTQSAAMASEILPGKTLVEALNTDLVCDAINVSMRQIFLALVYGRSQTAFSDGGLPIGEGLNDLGPSMNSQVGTSYGTRKGPRYLELTEGYVLELALDDKIRIIGYKYVNVGKMMALIRSGSDANQAMLAATGTTGRFLDAVRVIDPRKE